jgi:hypothetical protein
LAKGTLVAAAGCGAAVAAAWFFGRPGVTVTSSGPTLVSLHVRGLDTTVAGVHATSDGKAVALVADGDGLVPRRRLAQGQLVQVTASVAAPSWLRWLVGHGATTAAAVRTPGAAPSALVALASQPGRVRVHFDRAVATVQYRAGTGVLDTMRLTPPSADAELSVPAQAQAGSLEVAAAPEPWEDLAAQASTVTWFAQRPGQEPLALASPAPAATTATSNGPITLTFAGPVSDVLGATRPTINPSVAGSWTQPTPDTLAFTPSGFGFGPGSPVTVTFARPVSVVGDSAAATRTVSAETYHFKVAAGSMLRLEQLLAQLRYLPLTFTPAPGMNMPTTLAAEVASMSQPPAGSFSWRWGSTPSTLQSQWSVGSANQLLKGALMSFDSVRGAYNGYQTDPETVSQLADSGTWQALLQAALANQVDPNPYSYVFVTKAVPETLTLWQNGSVVLTSPANTGIAQAPTADGTFPVYIRYTVNHMVGTNPDGTPYNDLVYWISYFNGGDAVHGFERGSYGSPQSLGCVELPIGAAHAAFNDLAIGDLVTVAG